MGSCFTLDSAFNKFRLYISAISSLRGSWGPGHTEMICLPTQDISHTSPRLSLYNITTGTDVLGDLKSVPEDVVTRA